MLAWLVDIGLAAPASHQVSRLGRRPPVSLCEDRFCWRPPVSLCEDRFCWRRPVSHREDGLCRWFVGLRRPAQQGRRLTPPDGGSRCAQVLDRQRPGRQPLRGLPCKSSSPAAAPMPLSSPSCPLSPAPPLPLSSPSIPLHNIPPSSSSSSLPPAPLIEIHRAWANYGISQNIPLTKI